MTTPGTRLRDMRIESGIATVTEMAARIGKSRTYVDRVERDQAKLTAPDTIAAWADALGVATDDVYAACGEIPHDIADALRTGDVETFRRIREALG